MTRRLFRAAAFITLVVIQSLAFAPEPVRAQHGDGQREQWQRVDDVFQAMGVKTGATVADFGAGDGFFTVRLAKAVGDQGKVYAVDINRDVLRRLRTRVLDERLSQVEVIEGAVDDPRLPPGALDAVLIVNAYHEMKAFKELLPKLKASLKPDGRLVIVEPIAAARRDRSRDEQTRSHEIAIDFVKQETTAAGFVQVSMQDPFTTRSSAHDEMWILVLRPEGSKMADDAADSVKG